ncbi:MAG: S8 family serine peptidase [Bryobacteraceae bacterium]
MSSLGYKGGVSTAPYSRPAKSVLSGQVQLAIKLSDPPLVVAVGANAKQNGIAMTAAQQNAYLAQLKQKQDVAMSQIAALGGVELGRVSKGHNAIVISIDAKQLPALHNIAGVVAVRPVADYATSSVNVNGQPDLPTTLAYIGGTAVQNSGFTGQGVRIAMLDTGIDYTHYNLGGSGNPADYLAATAVAAGVPPANLFPTTKVVGGYDFTGDVWPNGPLAPDPNPIDLNGHGTLTSDTAGGHSLDGLHSGTAPGSQLYAVKVCSSVSSACSGVAILEGIDFALDPDNTGTVNNPVDIISMSIGGPFGQREDDDSEAITDVVNFGLVAVIAAGNSGDIPYIMGGPGATPEAIAVGATNSVVAFGIPLVINSPASIAGSYPDTATVDFAPINNTVTGNIVYVGRGCPADSTGAGSPADPYLANPSGAIALIDRGACNVSLKVDAAANAGAIGVLIGLVAPGDAVSFSAGGGSNFVPTLVITQATSLLIQSALSESAVNGTLSPDNEFPLSTNVASYSSRGPNYSYNMLKPDLSAPGTIMAADVGTGNGETTESGTSFATPLTSGSAALLLSKNHTLGPVDVKALLMENTEINVFNNAATQPGYLGPLSRTGSGELRVDRTVASSTSVWDASNPLAVSMSFGTYRLSANQSFKKKLVIRNYSGSNRTYTIANTYRDAPNNTGVTLNVPPSIFVAANSAASFNVSAAVNASALPAWTLNGGSEGGSGELLNTVEYAGLLNFTSGTETVNFPWHILPHQSANVLPASSSIALGGNVQLLGITNANSPISGPVDSFSLTGTEVQFPASVLPAPGSDYAVINLQAVGLRLVCVANCSTVSPAYGVQFAINTYGQRSHPDVPAEFDVYIDVNNDGNADLDVFNDDIGLITTGTFSGQNGVFIADLAAGTASGPYFYTVADLDSANAILTAPLAALTCSAGSVTVSNPFTFDVLAFDNYYTGNLTDIISGMQYELDMPQFYTFESFTVDPNVSGGLPIVPNNAANVYFSGPYNGNSPSQSGILFMYTNGKAGQEASPVTVTP